MGDLRHFSNQEPVTCSLDPFVASSSYPYAQGGAGSLCLLGILKKIDFDIYKRISERSFKRLVFGHRSFIKNIKQTAVIKILKTFIYNLDVSYASQHTFSKV